MRVPTLTAVVMLAPALAAAQSLEPPRPRAGYWIALGYYGALTEAWDEGTRLDVGRGTAQSLRLGQLLTRRLGLGLAIDFGGTASDDWQTTLGALGLEAQWEAATNLALRGGFGLAVVGLDDKRYEDEDLKGTAGSGYFLGASWDLFVWKKRLSGGLALAPVVQVRYLPGDLDAMVAFLGVEAAFWTGLPRNQLDLPESEAYKRR